MALYAEAAAVLAGVESRQGSIKSLVYASRFQRVKQLYALVCETQRYAAVLDAVIERAGLLRAEKKLRPHLAQVLVYELLLGRGFRGAGGGRWKQVLSRHQARLKAELARLKVQRGVSRNEDLLDAGSKPGGGESPRGWGVLDPSVGPPKKKGCLSGCAPCQLTHIVSQPPRCPGLCV